MHRRSFLFILLSTCLIFCHAQNIDSLKKVLQTTQHDTIRLTVLFALVEGINDDNVWPLYNEEALTLSEKLSHNKSALVAKKGKKGLADALNNIGYNYCNHGDIEKGLGYFEKCLKLQEALGDKKGIATTINNIGAVYNGQGSVDKALEYWNRSLKIQEEIGDKLGLSNSLNNIGIIYENYPGVGELGLTKALDHYKRSLKLRMEVEDKYGMAVTYNNIGLVYFKQNDISGSLEYYKKSLEMRKETGDKNGMANVMANIGISYLHLKQFNIAYKYCDSSISLSKEIGFPDQISSTENALSQIDSARGNFAGAFAHFKEYIFYRDSVNSERSRKAIYKSLLKSEFEKKELVLKEKQDKERIVAEENSRFQIIIICITFFVLLLVTVLALFIYKSLRENKKANVIIGEKQREILDSIHYAKRIQQALLPSDKLFAKEIKRLKK